MTALSHVDVIAEAHQRIGNARAALDGHGVQSPAMCACGRSLHERIESSLLVCPVAAAWWAELRYWSGKLALLEKTVVLPTIQSPEPPSADRLSRVDVPAPSSWWRRLRLGGAR